MWERYWLRLTVVGIFEEAYHIHDIQNCGLHKWISYSDHIQDIPSKLIILPSYSHQIIGGFDFVFPITSMECFSLFCRRKASCDPLPNNSQSDDFGATQSC